MGINSTEVAYNFGQLGSGFTDQVGALTPPSGMVIIAMTFLGDTTFSTLAADTSGIDGSGVAGNVGYFSHAAPAAAVHGSGSVATTNNQIFPAGLTIYGRWTQIAIAADPDGGVICYYGK